MRKISLEASNAFCTNIPYKQSNTEVIVSNDMTILKLHGNSIAISVDDNHFLISTCGWDTKTTRERLNALPGVHVYKKKGQLYLNGTPWDGHDVSIACPVSIA